MGLYVKATTTGELAKALKPFLPHVSGDMVRFWCESGKLESWRNPIAKAGKHFIGVPALQKFLKDELGFCSLDVSLVLQKLGVKTQL